MVQKKVVVRLKNGLQSRPAAFFVLTANKFSSEIFVLKGNQKLNAKSVIGIMSLGLKPGAEVILSAEGIDASDAVEALNVLLSKE